MVLLAASIVLGMAPSVKQVSGTMFNVFLTTDGAVYGIGNDEHGMHVRPDWVKANVTRPAKMALPAGIKQVAASHYSCYALLSNGTVLAWGRNDVGQLGDGLPEGQGAIVNSTPVQVKGLSNIVQIDACGRHAVALAADGRVYSWGPDVPPFNDWSTPKLVEGLSNVKQVDTGLRHTLALTKDGRIYAWGSNQAGQIGVGTVSVSVDKPSLVNGLSKVVSISASDGDLGHSGAVTSDGKAYVWGSNQSCLFGNGLRSGSSSERGALSTKPLLVKGVNGAKQISLSAGSVAVLLSNGGLMTWGFDGYGQLGQGKSGDYTYRPKKVNISGVTSVYAAGYRTFALKKDGSVWWSGVGTNSRSGPMSQKAKVFTKLPIQ